MIKKVWKLEWVGGVFIMLLTLAVYFPAMKGGFIWDDDAHLTENPCIIGPLGLKEIWTTSAARICPLVLTSFWVQHAIWGLNPLPYHLVNILMHGACGVVLWLVLRSLKVRGAWMGAALWALHPVQVESAAWITELKNTQSGLFYLLAVLFFVKWRQRKVLPQPQGGEGYYVFALLCGGLAMTSKSSTVILPLVLGLCVWWVEGCWAWRNAARLSPFFLLSGAMSAVSVWTQRLEGVVGAEWARSWPERVVTAGKVVWFYLGKLVWPHPLTFIYPRWKIDATQVVSYLPVVAVVLVLGVLLWLRDKWWGRPLFVAFVYFLMALLPVLGLVDHYFLRYSYVGDHFEYLASMGPLALAGAAIWTAFDRLEARECFVRPVFCGVLLAVLGVLTWRQTGVYRSSETLWRDTLAKNPTCWIAHNNLGLILKDRGKLAEAETHFRDVLKRDPKNVDVLNNLGLVLISRGQYTKAITCFVAALKEKADFVAAHYNMGIALGDLGENDQAIEQYTEAARLDPTLSDTWNNLGNALAAKGRFDEAVVDFQKAIRCNSQDAKIYNNLGGVLVSQGKLEQAVECYHNALRYNPGLVEARKNLGTVLVRQGKPDEAVAQYEQVVRLVPDDAAACVSLAAALVLQHKYDEAIASYTEALRLAPNDALTHYNLAYLLAELGRLDEAMHQYDETVRLKPDYAEAHNNLGNILLLKGQLDEAVVHFRAALQSKPDYAEAHGNLGVALAAQGKYAEAILHYTNALRLEPNSATTHSNLGCALMQVGRLDEAVEQLDEALRLKPDYAPAHFHLGCVLARLGRRGEAVTQLTEALRLRPNDAEAKRQLQALGVTVPE